LTRDGSLKDDEAMSAEIDRHLTENPVVGEFHPGNPEVEVVVELAVEVDSETLRLLEERAAETGRLVSQVAADALRAGTR
jgi:hypothetical protein